MSEHLFKCLEKGRIGPHSKYKWPRCGVWIKAKGLLSPCQNGIHLCREKDLMIWLNEEIYEAEYRGERIDMDDKIVVREARLRKRLKTWNAKTAQLFGYACKAKKKELTAVRDVARNIVRDAEYMHMWQTAKLMEYLCPK